MKISKHLAAALLLAAAPAALMAQTTQTAPATAEAEVAAAAVPAGSGATVVPPEGWIATRTGPVLTFAAPEGDASVAIVAVPAASDAAAAIKAGWAAFDPAFDRPVALTQDPPARDGWDKIVVSGYEAAPAERAAYQAIALQKGDAWTVVLVQGATATLAKRGAQLGKAMGTLKPADFTEESFAGKTAHTLTPDRVAVLKDFLAKAMKELAIPGAGVAFIDDDRVVWEGGIGVRELGKAEPVDADTRFMIASNTKGMTTLLLSALADSGKLSWDQKVTDLYPAFRLGDAETTDRVLVRHLVCACTGLPRKDMQWIIATSPETPASDTFVQLAATQPTTKFGETFQYNNLMASAAGYLAGHLYYPDMELGAAYDRAMAERIFAPLGMTRTTFDHAEAMRGNWARPHARALTEAQNVAEMRNNFAVDPYRPAGGAWSSAHDMALYALNELREGRTADGKTLFGADNLLLRRAHAIATGRDSWYGMGLMESSAEGVPIVFHGGSLLGYKSNFWVIPSAGVGAVLLTNADEGQALLGLMQRRLLEVLYDGKPEAEENLAAIVRLGAEARAKGRENLEANGDPKVLAGLASAYRNEELGTVRLSKENGHTYLTYNAGRAIVATRRNIDGTYSLVTASPGFTGVPLLIGTEGGKRTLLIDDGQHRYVLTEVEG